MLAYENMRALVYYIFVYVYALCPKAHQRWSCDDRQVIHAQDEEGRG